MMLVCYLDNGTFVSLKNHCSGSYVPSCAALATSREYQALRSEV